MAFLPPSSVPRRIKVTERNFSSSFLCRRFPFSAIKGNNGGSKDNIGSTPPFRVPFPNMVAEAAENTSVIAQTNPTTEGMFSAKGMTVEEFFEKSNGDWKSQRSSHNLAWGQFEAVTSAIKIEAQPATNESVVELCKQNDVSMNDVLLSLSMSWEGESDWDDDEVMSGSTVMSVIKDGPSKGRLLRSMGYAETIPAVGQWEMTPDGVFVLSTFYDAAAAEERIWFATPDLRMRVSQIRTSSGRGVVTASFSTEIRKLKVSEAV